MEILMSVRAATVADHAQLTSLFAELDRLHREGAPWLFELSVHDPRPLEWLEALLRSSDSALFVADAGMCVGLASVHMRHAPQLRVFIRQRHAVIDDLIVHPDWRRKGVARRLCQACEQWALERGASWAEATVYDFNSEASGFYGAVGFASTTWKMRKPLAG
jgi:GNAT superfamily N-acetyltransferase